LHSVRGRLKKSTKINTVKCSNFVTFFV
jgi:hypothetical protein